MTLPEGGKANGSIYAALGSDKGSGIHLKCLCTNTHSMKNKQEEVLVHSLSYDVTAISETWWDESHDQSAGMEAYRPFKKKRHGRQAGGVILYVRERPDHTALAWMMNLQVKIKGTQNKAHTIRGGYYWPTGSPPRTTAWMSYSTGT